MKTGKHFVVLSAVMALAAQTACAWSLFGLSASNASGRLKSADRILEKADIAFEEGDVSTAGSTYARALEKYLVIERDYPGFNDGIASIRVEYCRAQMAECGVEIIAPFAGEGEDAKGGVDVSGEHGAKKPSNSSGTTAPVAAAPAAPVAAVPVATADVAPEVAPKAASGSASAAEAFRALASEPEPVAAAEREDDAPAATAYNPRYLAYDFGEARDLIEQGNFADAIDILVPMVKYDPDNRQIRMLLATARLGAGHADLAIATLEDLRGRREDFPLLLMIAAAYTSAGRYPDALLALDAAAKLAPGEPDPYSNLAWLTMLMEGDTAESRAVARNYYNQALKRGAARDPSLEGIITGK